MNSLTRKVPVTDATGVQIPRTPATMPRCPSGTWSGSTATSAASSALKKTWAMHHPTRTTAMPGARAIVAIPAEPPSSPITIHGRRLPHRRGGAVAHPAEERVRDDRQQAADAGDERQLVRRSFRTHQRVHLQGQRDQEGREEQQARAQHRQRVEHDESRSHSSCRGESAVRRRRARPLLRSAARPRRPVGRAGNGKRRTLAHGALPVAEHLDTSAARAARPFLGEPAPSMLPPADSF